MKNEAVIGPVIIQTKQENGLKLPKSWYHLRCFTRPRAM